jgi:hypothetical protein
MNTTYAHLTHTPCTKTDHITPHRFEDRVLKEITESIQGSVDEGHADIPLWLHAKEAVLIKMKKIGPVAPQLEHVPLEVRLDPRV